MALLVAEVFKILVHANEMTYDVTLWTQNDAKLQISGICLKTLFVWNCNCTVVANTTKFPDISTDISMATQWAPDPLHSKHRIRIFSFKKCYLLLLFI